MYNVAVQYLTLVDTAPDSKETVEVHSKGKMSCEDWYLAGARANTEYEIEDGDSRRRVQCNLGFGTCDDVYNSGIRTTGDYVLYSKDGAVTKKCEIPEETDDPKKCIII